MKKTIITILITGLIVGGAVWFLQKNNNQAELDTLNQKIQELENPIQTDSSIIITSPNGGEEWLAGSTHNITWSSDNIDNYKIGIHIREANAVSQDGQNFDPVLMINLDNDGNEKWNIPDDFPNSDYLIEIVAYESIPITESISDGSDASFRITGDN